jgi:hypothetical protein
MLMEFASVVGALRCAGPARDGRAHPGQADRVPYPCRIRASRQAAGSDR